MLVPLAENQFPGSLATKPPLVNVTGKTEASGDADPAGIACKGLLACYMPAYVPPWVLLVIVMFSTLMDGIGGGTSFSLLQSVPLGIYLVFRPLLGSIFCGLLAALLYGWGHLLEALNPSVVFWTMLWSGVYILLGNVFWFGGLAGSTPLQISVIGALYLPLSLCLRLSF